MRDLTYKAGFPAVLVSPNRIAIPVNKLKEWLNRIKIDKKHNRKGELIV